MKKLIPRYQYGNLIKPKYKKSEQAYYDKDTDTVYAPDSLGEFYHHEMFHARPDSAELVRLKPYYDNLNDNKLLELGADLPFVKRINNDPGYLYNPEEVGARVKAARHMLNNAGVKKIDKSFFKEARKNENAYGNNFRDLLHMYNDNNLIGIFGNSHTTAGYLYNNNEKNNNTN